MGLEHGDDSIPAAGAGSGQGGAEGRLPLSYQFLAGLLGHWPPQEQRPAQLVGGAKKCCRLARATQSLPSMTCTFAARATSASAKKMKKA